MHSTCMQLHTWTNSHMRRMGGGGGGGVLFINTHLNHTHCGSLRPKNTLRSTTGVFIESSFKMDPICEGICHQHYCMYSSTSFSDSEIFTKYCLHTSRHLSHMQCQYWCTKRACYMHLVPHTKGSGRVLTST